MKILFFMLFVAGISHANDNYIVFPRTEIEDLNLYPTVLDGDLVKGDSSFNQYTVKIEVYSDNWSKSESNCSGVVIAQDIVLTAGHCFHANNVNVAVKFGVGGKAKYEFIENSKIFYALNDNHGYVGKINSPNQKIVNGHLNINLESQNLFFKEVSQRVALLNYFGIPWVEKMDFNKMFNDFALIKISKLPKGYKPIRFYEGSYQFKEELFYLGYGTNNIEIRKSNSELRTAKAYLIGHYTKPNEYTKGIQTYSPEKKSMCFGDSGGPLVTKVNGEDFLIGINTFVMNNCGSSTWHLVPSYFSKEINNIIKILRSVKSI